MPVQYVFGPSIAVDSPDDEGQVEEPMVSISWREGGDVQVGCMSRDHVSKSVMNEGYFVDLDRRGINDLIRHLRRARDRAFGRDE